MGSTKNLKKLFSLPRLPKLFFVAYFSRVLKVCISLILALFLIAPFVSFGTFGVLGTTNKAYASNVDTVKQGVLTVATSPDYPPFAELDGDNVVGFEADIWNELASRMGLSVEVKNLNFDAIITSVASSSQCDIGMAGISVSPERAKTVDLSDSYYVADLSFAVLDKSAITESNAYYMLSDSDLTFAVQSGTTAESYVLENYPKARVSSFSSANDCFSAVAAGKADVVCSTTAVINSSLKGSYSDIRVVKNVATGEQYAIAVSKDNPELLAEINKHLKDMKNDGTLFKFALKIGLSGDMYGVPAYIDKLSTVKCSAQSNSDFGNDVLALKPTRITWEGIAGTNEILNGLSLTLPSGTQFDANDGALYVLKGDDLMERVEIPCEFSSEGSVIYTKFSDSNIEPGSYFRLELSNVVFPETSEEICSDCSNGDVSTMAVAGAGISSDGDVTIKGSYSLAGNTSDMFSGYIDDIPTFKIQKMNVFQKAGEWLDSQDFVKAWNSLKFCNLFLNPSVFVRSIPIVFQGFIMALLVVICAFPLAVPIGVCLALMRLSKLKLLRGIASLFVNIVRGTPLFLQIYIAFFGLPLAGVNIPNFTLGLIVLALNSSAYLCEIFRAGIQSVDIGQTEAARSLGLSSRQSFFYVVFPQAFKNVLPTVTSEFILLFKDTSLLASVGVMEIVMYSKTIVATTGSVTPYVVAAVFYLVITIPLAKIVGNIEKKMFRKAKLDVERQPDKKSRNIPVFPSAVDKRDNKQKVLESELMGSM